MVIYSICGQSYILKWTPDWKRTKEERKKWIIWVQEHYLKATKDVARIMLAVTLKASKELIGMVGIGNKDYFMEKWKEGLQSENVLVRYKAK